MGSKTTKVKGQSDMQAETQTAAPAETAATPAAPAKAAVPRTRGPRGTTEDAVITVIATTNPKRPASKAFKIFGNYENGMTIKAFADKVDADAETKGMSTVALVYDAKHGFISIAGYDPGAIIVPKPKAPKKEKAPKVVKGQSDATADAETKTEQMA